MSSRLQHPGCNAVGVTDTLLEDWWSTENVATFLGVARSTVSAYVTRHQMPQPDRYIGRTRLWRPDTIREWQQARPRSQPDNEDHPAACAAEHYGLPCHDEPKTFAGDEWRRFGPLGFGTG